MINLFLYISEEKIHCSIFIKCSAFSVGGQGRVRGGSGGVGRRPGRCRGGGERARGAGEEDEETGKSVKNVLLTWMRFIVLRYEY